MRMGSDERRERGSTLLLAPVMFLILLMLAGITIDWSSAFLAKREALNAADAAANDAAAAAIDAGTFQDDDTILLDGAVAQRVAWASLRRRLSSVKDLQATATVVDVVQSKEARDAFFTAANTVASEGDRARVLQAAARH